MPTATVSRWSLQQGDLPAVCVKTGEPADGTVSVRFSSLPSWTFLLLLAGIFPFLIALVFANEQIVAQVPIRQPVLDHYHLLTRRASVCAGFAVACGVAAAVSGFAWMWWVAALGAVAGVAILLQRATGWVRARPVRGTSLIDLDGVSAAFATAVKDQHRAS